MPPRMTAFSSLGFALPFLFAALVPILFYAFAATACLGVLGLLVAALIGSELVFARGESVAPDQDDVLLESLPVLFAPVQIGLIVWSGIVAPGLTAAGFLSLALAVGVIAGVFGMLAAHELVHRHDRASRALGLCLLTAMSYRHFRIAHVLGHHRHAGTSKDPATAKLGESFYAFLPRTVYGQFIDAWRIETRRLGASGQGGSRHRIAQDVAVMAGIWLAVWLALDWRTLTFFVCQSAIAIFVLELFNYIAHYGLARTVAPHGHEPMGHRHSWNSSNTGANAIIFNMGRHSSHHARPALSYHRLTYVAAAPELPAGYAGSILLALVPALWRAVMDRQAISLRQDPANARTL